MNIIWKLESEPELAALSKDELKCLVREAGEAKPVRRSSLIGLMLCGLCTGMGSLIFDTFSAGIYGAGVGGAAGGFVCSQIRSRAILKWIRERGAALMLEDELTPS